MLKSLLEIKVTDQEESREGKNCLRGKHNNDLKSTIENDDVKSITSSPVRHQIRYLQDINDNSKTLKKRMALIYDRTDFEKSEAMFEVHNALGKFSCQCNICVK